MYIYIPFRRNDRDSIFYRITLNDDIIRLLTYRSTHAHISTECPLFCLLNLRRFLFFFVLTYLYTQSFVSHVFACLFTYL